MIKRNIGDEIIQGMTEAIEYTRGNEVGAAVHKVEIPDEIDQLIWVSLPVRAEYAVKPELNRPKFLVSTH